METAYKALALDIEEVINTFNPESVPAMGPRLAKELKERGLDAGFDVEEMWSSFIKRHDFTNTKGRIAGFTEAGMFLQNYFGEEKLAEVDDAYCAAMAITYDALPLLDILKDVDKSTKIFVTSSGRRATLEHFFKNHDFRTDKTFAPEYNPMETKEQMYGRMLDYAKEQGIQPHEILAVDDRKKNIDIAKKLGMHTLWCPFDAGKYRSEPLKAQLRSVAITN